MLQAAQRLLNSKRADLDRLLAENPGYCIRLVGHSLGAGTAALITILLKRGAGAHAQILTTVTDTQQNIQKDSETDKIPTHSLNPVSDLPRFRAAKLRSTLLLVRSADDP